jgi:hypothetical protein
MEKLSAGQRRLMAEFLSNIGVAWFAAGVIGMFPFWQKGWLDAGISFVWGLGFSIGFLRVSLVFVKGVKS